MKNKIFLICCFLILCLGNCYANTNVSNTNVLNKIDETRYEDYKYIAYFNVGYSSYVQIFCSNVPFKINYTSDTFEFSESVYYEQYNILEDSYTVVGFCEILNIYNFNPKFVLASNFDILDFNGNMVFQAPPSLVGVAKMVTVKEITMEMVGLIPLLISLIIFSLAFRKGFRLLVNFLHGL